MQEKDAIIADKMTKFLRRKRVAALEELDELVGGLEERRAAVEAGDVNDIVRQQNSLGSLREDIEATVTEVWVDLITEQEKLIDSLRESVLKELKDVREDIRGAVKIEVKFKKKTKGTGFLRTITFGAVGYEEVPYEKRVLDQGELEAAIRDFSEDIEHKVGAVVDKVFHKSFAIEAVKALRRVIAVKLTDDEIAASINVPVLRRALRESVMRIVAESDKRLEAARKSLFGAMGLSFEYDGDSLKKGQRKGRNFVEKAVDEAIKWIDACKAQIDFVADRAKAELVPAIVAEMEDYEERLMQELENREFSLQRYSLAVDELTAARQRLERTAGSRGGS